MEKMLWLIECVKVVYKVSCWRFLAGQCSMFRLGRPVEVDSNQIETVIENSQWYTMWEIGDIVKISTSIKLLVKMKSVSFICLLYTSDAADDIGQV